MLQFNIFDAFKLAYKRRYSDSPGTLAMGSMGICATLAASYSVYPFGVIRTIQQVAGTPSGELIKFKSFSMKDIAVALYQSGGVRAFYKGGVMNLPRNMTTGSMMLLLHERITSQLIGLSKTKSEEKTDIFAPSNVFSFSKNFSIFNGFINCELFI